MQTVRQIERYWTARQYDRLARELLRARPESCDRLALEFARAVPAAALALIRLDEFNQAGHALNGKFIRTILAAQEGDGGWGDPLTTALCLRALFCNDGQGVALHRGMEYLAALQKSNGAWPALPIPRTVEDPFVSAFILFHLADQRAFRAAVRLDDALHWFSQHEAALAPDARRLWDRAHLRARLATLTAAN